MALRCANFLLLFLLPFQWLYGEPNFKDYFKEQSLRVDFILAGDFELENAYLEKIILEPYWGGRKSNLDAFHGLGTYQFQLVDNLTKSVIYVDGFCTLFEEWQSTQDAYKTKRSFYNSITMPLPFRKSTLTLLKRVKGEFTDTLLTVPIDPAGDNVRTATFPEYRIKDMRISADPAHAVDIVLLAEGYTRNEANQFFEDAKKFEECFAESTVFSENLNRLNIRAIAVVSENSGCDDPAKDEWVETCFNSTFNTIGISRYLMTSDINAVRNIAAMVPYDQVFVLVNTDKYGGGGIFNSIGICASRAENFEEVILHELGHEFAGLGDEYVASDNVLMADLSLEPWESNLTLFSGKTIKWQNLIKEGIPLPTPDSLGRKDENLIGLFAGGGYVSEGIYRPAYNCRMRTNEAEDFCIVCKNSIRQMFDFYTGENAKKQTRTSK